MNKNHHAGLSQPETRSQARTHDRYARAYLDAGLCSGCAYQAAYGHQLGFANVRPLCGRCVAVAAKFPTAKANGWRALTLSTYGRPVSADLMSARAAGCTRSAGGLDAHTDGASAVWDRGAA